MQASELVIAEVEAGAGLLGISPLPGLTAGLGPDIARIRDWGAEAVLSMTEVEEMRRLGSGGLGRAVEAAGMAWHHLPILDFGGPRGETARLWPLVADEVHGRLDHGGQVLVHCRAGMGRSGMAVLRLLVERGEDPRQALARIRKVRPGAVETAGQRDWAAAGATTPWRGNPVSD